MILQKLQYVLWQQRKKGTVLSCITYITDAFKMHVYVYLNKKETIFHYKLRS